ncbi:MAG: nickel pincer cofactor biosynthesis protein LarC [Verrucomicrobiae bacterium]|nr:nickel pincer cofactor biosynthesis protein LarC [Verrucomicrobiae bacterium]
MKALYFDCLSGISGDMTVGALLDLGCSRKRLEAELGKLGISREYRLRMSRETRNGLKGMKFGVEILAAHQGCSHGRSHRHGRSFADIKKLIDRSRLSSFVKKHATNMFRRLAAAEGAVHGVAAEKVHFHEVGAVDSLADMVGVCVLMEELGPQKVLASIPVEGHGTVECQHGRFPVPAPATVELLKGVAVCQIDLEGELITPTGAAILTEFVQTYGPMGLFTVQKTGHGFGTRQYKDHPNVLRVFWGDAPAARAEGNVTQVKVIETNMDDLTPELLADAAEKLRKAGALDVWVTPCVMKKGRNGACLSVLAGEDKVQELVEMIFCETGSFGVRVRTAERFCLDREIKRIKTRLGVVEIKVGRWEGRIVSAKPEFESCRKLAERLGKTTGEVWRAALEACKR